MPGRCSGWGDRMTADVIDWQRYGRLYRKALEGELNRWGKWIEKHSDYEGFPGANILVAFLMGRGGSNPGHRILCLDMPTDVYSVHARILMLTEDQREAVWIYYVVRLKEDGTTWTLRERCQRVDVSEEALRMRVSRARTKLLGLSVEEVRAAPLAAKIAT